METKLVQEVYDATSFLKSKIKEKPHLALILGSGLGYFTERIQDKIEIPYSEVPHFKETTVEGHAGKVIFGKINDINIVALQGRTHLYEGYDMKTIALPTRALCMLGIQHLVLTNAAGGININFKPGDLMLINDHINFMGQDPLRGKESTQLGPRFPSMTQSYHMESRLIFLEIAKERNITLHEGVYTALCGPTFETPAEIRMLRTLGADAVGMSTVPEAIAARHMGVRVSGLSCITNMAAGIESGKEFSHEEVQLVARKAADQFGILLEEGIPRICK